MSEPVDAINSDIGKGEGLGNSMLWSRGNIAYNLNACGDRKTVIGCLVANNISLELILTSYRMPLDVCFVLLCRNSRV